MSREEILEAALRDAIDMICNEWGTSLEEIATSYWSGYEALIRGAKLLVREDHEVLDSTR